jgi:Phage tail assembly chaperone protein, TAC
MNVLPWSQLLSAAAQIGVTPAAFWALSVKEWRALMGEGFGLDTGRLSELMAAFPDSDRR